MAKFALHIECSKDISKLNIDFTDGSTMVTEEPKTKDNPSNIKHSTTTHQEFLDTDTEFGNVSQEVIQKPEIKQQERPVKIATELQNLDI